MGLHKVENFTGGITDKVLAGDPASAKELKDFDIDLEGKLVQRDGFGHYDDTYPRIPESNYATDEVFVLDYEGHEIALIINDKIRYKKAGQDWTEVRGYGNEKPFESMLGGKQKGYYNLCKISHNRWVICDGERIPRLLFVDEEGDLRVVPVSFRIFEQLDEANHDPSKTFEEYDPDVWICDYDLFLNFSNYDIAYLYAYVTKFVIPNKEGDITYITSCHFHKQGGWAAGWEGVENGCSYLKKFGGEGGQITKAWRDYYDEPFPADKCFTEVYRKELYGNNYYKVKSVSHVQTGNPLYEVWDTVYEDDLIKKDPAYFNGGLVAFEPIDICRYVTVSSNDTVWYGGIKKYACQGFVYEDHKNRLVQCVQGNPQATGSTWFLDFEDEITGVSTIGVKPIVGEKKSLYRIDGEININNVGTHIKQVISSDTGVISHNSMVKYGQKVFFASREYFAMTDGYKVYPIGRKFSERYQRYLNEWGEENWRNIKGVLDEKHNKIYWTFQRDADDKFVFVLNLDLIDQGISSFTTYEFKANRITVDDDHLVFTDNYGYVYKMVEGELNQLEIANKVSAEKFVEAIVPEYVSTTFNFGTDIVKKWCSNVVMILENLSNVSLDLFCGKDNSETYKDMRSIIFDNHATNDKLIIKKRRFSKMMLRCYSRIFGFRKAYRMLASGAGADVTADRTLFTGSGLPSGLEGNWLHLSDDGFVQARRIISATDDTIIVGDDQDVMTIASGLEWHVMGYARDEIIKVRGFEIPYKMFGNISEGNDVPE